MKAGDNNCRAWRTSRNGRYFPLLLVLLVIGCIDVLVPWSVRFTDFVALVYGLGNPRQNKLGTPISVFVAQSARVQGAAIAVWLVFGSGKWLSRVTVALLTSAMVVVLISISIPRPPNQTYQIDSLRIGAAMLDLLAYSAPLVMWRLWRGYGLVHNVDARGPDSPIAYPRFAIRDVLAVTAIVAGVFAVTRMSADSTARPDAALAGLGYMSLHNALWSLVYVVPIAWAALAVRRTKSAIVLLAVLTTMFFAVDWALLDRVYNFRLTATFWRGVGNACGTILTVPGALLVWRYFGWRLVAPSRRGETLCTDNTGNVTAPANPR